MILLDTTPLVGLCDPSDRLHARARHDAARLGRDGLVVTDAVLAEAFHLLPVPLHRERLARFIEVFPISPWSRTDAHALRLEALRWMERYAEHRPDWADATLVIACAREPKARVWTYDSEFRTTWRRPNGTRIPLAAR